MKIKKLTIHGFKSFVDKVTFNFPSGTSAVIGPNGCGKSNIVDAIRWVLGEQNARHLRGKLMEDVIFNGSEARKPLGMAEVVLTFSNEGGTAPARFANFTEIEISRRLYRSGESEYYINKVQSRLRDIVDLFTDTGIGTRAYSIIEQGQVGWLINAKPEERRIIFEEAAGINKFKHKKEAALRRLEATRENLTRVNDIISEVKRQLNSLNRQAKKAERYKAFRQELQSVDLLLSSFEFNKLKEEIGSTAKRLEALKDQEFALTNDINRQEGLSEEVKVDCLKEEGEYRAIRERIFELEKAIQNEERASALARMRIDELERAQERLVGEIDELEGSRNTALEQTAELNATLSDAASCMEEEARRLEANGSMLDSVSTELKAKEEAGRSLRADSLRISTRLADIRHLLQTNLKDEEFSRVKEAKAAAEREEAAKAIASKGEPIRALAAGVEALWREREEAEAGLKGVREALEALEKNKTEKEGQLKLVKDDYARASARLSTLEEMERNFENIKDGARAIMLKGANNGVHGLLADVIEANAGYEKAVEAVLGDRLQYVLVESHKEGVAAIEYLKAQSCGRGSFVPVRDARALAEPLAVQAGSLYPGARELVGELKIKEGYETIINYLLGDTLITDDLESALEIWRQDGIYKTLVTLDGEIVDPQGIITGGAARNAEAGILQKRNEIKKIKAQAQALEGRISALEAEAAGAEDEIARTKALIEESREKLHSIEISRVNLEGELKKEREESARLEKTLQSAEADIAEAGKRILEMTASRSSLGSERDSLEAELSGIESGLTELSHELSALNRKKEEFLHVVTEIRVSIAQATERHESVRRQLQDRQRSIEDTEKRLASRKEEIERGKKETAGKLEELEAAKARLEGLLSRTDSVKKEEVQKTETLTALNEKIKEIEAGLKELKGRASELQELKGELTIDLKEMELGLANLKERITERYGADISSFTAAGDEGPVDLESLEARKEDLRARIAELGEVSLSALEEYAELERRQQFLLDQQADLTRSVEALHTAISRINRTTREKFKQTFEEISAKFHETFPRFFNGGRAELRLTDEGDLLEAGVEIVVQPPGKRLQNITLLSGGEKALTATALIFAIFLIKPSPFCLLDEVDAPLDEANIDRFNMFVRDMSKLSQFLLITHNKKTMEMADALYGITMEEPGVSKIISVKF